MAGKRHFEKTTPFGIVDRVHVPRDAQTRATYRFFRIELRNTVLFRSSKSHMSFLRYHAVTDGISRDFVIYVILQRQAAKRACTA
jgi:hypothetical protein